MLVYDNTSVGGQSEQAIEAGRARPDVERRFTVRAVVALLWRRAPWILLCALVGAVMAFGVGKLLTPRYTAQVQLYIDPRDLRLFDKELTPGNQDSAGLLTIVESQAQVITSNSVLKRVVERLDLVRDAEFSTGHSESRDKSDAAEASDETTLALDTLKKRVGVGRSGRTFIVDVSVWSKDAAKAARIANAIAAAYLEEDAANRLEAAKAASAGLTAQLAELRNAVISAENRVQAYKIEHRLIGTKDTLVTDQQLTQLNTQLAAARVRVADAQARYDQLTRIRDAGLDQGANGDALASPTISALRSQYADLRRRQTELLQELGPQHPLLRTLGPQAQETRRLIDQEVARYLQSARTDLMRAQATVATLEQDFELAQRKTTKLEEASIGLRQLHSEVDASRSIYQAFLVRAREIGQQARLNLGNARIITTAIKPLLRSYPPPARVLVLAGLVAGLGLAVLAVFAEEMLRRGDFREPNPREGNLGERVSREEFLREDALPKDVLAKDVLPETDPKPRETPPDVVHAEREPRPRKAVPDVVRTRRPESRIAANTVFTGPASAAPRRAL